MNKRKNILLLSSSRIRKVHLMNIKYHKLKFKGQRRNLLYNDGMQMQMYKIPRLNSYLS